MDISNESISLDFLGIIEGTDKSSIDHNYLDSYEELIRPLKDEPITLIEIGIASGSSLRVWASYFSQARIVGIDVQRSMKIHESGRITVEIGSQDDPEFLGAICARYQPTIIIDDGSHLGHDIIFTFERLFPSLMPGGLYMVEDLNLFYGARAREFSGGGACDAPAYFLGMCNRLMAGWLDGERSSSDTRGIRRYMFDHIQKVSFIRHAAVVHKKAQAQDLAMVIERAIQIAEQTNSATAWDALLRLVLANRGATDVAERAAGRAAELMPGNVGFRRRLSQVKMMRGQRDDALRIALEALDLDEGDVGTLHHLGNVYAELGGFADAERCFLRALELGGDNAHFCYNLSLAQAKQDKLAQALASANAAVQLDPSGPWATTYRAHLSALSARVGAPPTVSGESAAQRG